MQKFILIMIQRVQSIFLLVAAIIMISVLFLPIWGEADIEAQEVINLNAFEIEYVEVDDAGTETIISEYDTWWISVVAVLSAVVALFSIFQFRNRLRQIQLGALNSLLMGGTIGLSYYYSYKGDMMLNPDEPGNYFIGFYIMVGALLFNSLANRFIRKDEKLVRNADRIR